MLTEVCVRNAERSGSVNHGLIISVESLVTIDLTAPQVGHTSRSEMKNNVFKI